MFRRIDDSGRTHPVVVVKLHDPDREFNIPLYDLQDVTDALYDLRDIDWQIYE